jgi:CHAT domain-containing protein
VGKRLALSEAVLASTGRYVSEQQQIKAMQQVRQGIDWMLSIDPAGRSVEESYASLLRWKGAIFSRQQRLREARTHAQGPQLLEQWAATSGQLSTLILRPPLPNEAPLWNERVEQLTREKDQLELGLMNRAPQRAEVAPNLEEIKGCLPPRGALVDFLAYSHYRYDKDGRFHYSSRYAAFIVRPNQKVVRVTIPNAPVIDQLIDTWRETLNWSRSESAKLALANQDDAKLIELAIAAENSRNEAAAKLGALLWEPIAQHLAGVEIVLVSPDEALAKFPFASLPGKRKDTYLVEDVSIGIVPIPRAIPELVGRSKIDDKSVVNTMLLVGDVSYSLGPSGSASSTREVESSDALRSRLPYWFTPLAGTGPEINSIQGLFSQHFRDGKAVALTKTNALESAIRRSMVQSRWIHLATHGFFAEDIIAAATKSASLTGTSEDAMQPKTALTVAPEGLMSGLAFAGANDDNASFLDDGIMCAMEVAALDLSQTELAVLSACETGLGKTLSGEGVLGLQRAFQVAGARSTISSLWPVSDEASRLMMTRFYRNLWEKKMSKIDALRETQIWMINAARQPSAGSIDPKTLTIDSATLPPLWHQPQFWSPFVLSGQWE